MPPPIRLALVGAGIFAREAHVPAIQALGDRYEIAAIYSRTRASAEALLPLIGGQPDVYTELTPLLQRKDIEAVDLLLPIDLLPAAVDTALAAGKHVISEKPITPDVATGRRLLGIHRNHPQQVWMVAENYRYEAAFARAAEIVNGGELGRVILATWTLHLPTLPGNKYFGTDWRRSGTFPGGFLLDGGVHHVAAMRQVLGAITHVSAEVRQMHPDLVPSDTLSAVMTFAGGFIGSYTVTYAGGSPFPGGLTVVGENGALRVNSRSFEVAINGEPRTEDFSNNRSVNDELAAFADAVRDGAPHRNSPLEALRDVAVIEAMLKSGETGERVMVDPLRDLEVSA